MAGIVAESKLTKQQLAILVLIYQLRFVTTKHIQAKLGNKQLQQTQRRMNLLVAKGYIGRNYTSKDRLNGRYATYYLTALGMKLLKRNWESTNASVLHSIYKDKNASERFIAHCVAVGDVWCALKAKHGDLMSYYPKSSLVGFEYLPQDFKPDAFIKLKTKLGKGSRTKEYLLYVCEEATPLFVHKKMVKQLLAYAEEGEWEAEKKTKLPTMLMICDTDRLKTKLQKMITSLMDDSYMDEDEIRFEVKTV